MRASHSYISLLKRPEFQLAWQCLLDNRILKVSCCLLTSIGFHVDGD